MVLASSLAGFVECWNLERSRVGILSFGRKEGRKERKKEKRIEESAYFFDC